MSHFQNAPVKPDYLHFDPATRHVRIDPHQPDFVQNPYAAYAWLHHNARVFFWEDYGFWCFAGYDDINKLFRDRRFGREEPGGYRANAINREHLKDFDGVERHSMLEIEPPVHTRLRTLVNRAFVSRQVERLRPRIEKLANELIDGFEHQGHVDLMPAFATPIPVVVIAEMLGVPTDNAPQLLDWSHRMVNMYMHNATREVEDSANQAAKEFSDYLRDYAAQRRKNPGDDLLSLLLAAEENGAKLSEDELITTCILLLNAGHEATVNQTGNAVKSILQSGLDHRTLFATPESTAAVVEESLRFDAPLHMFTRYAYNETEIAEGVTLKAGEQLGLLLGSGNRDYQAFDQPDRFWPERPDQKNVSFGAGIHFCIGAPLARLEMQVSLATLFKRLPNIRFAEPPLYGDTYHFHGMQSLKLEW